MPVIQAILVSFVEYSPPRWLMGGLIPASLAIVALMLWTAFEDRTLREASLGYANDANRVRAKLSPRIW